MDLASYQQGRPTEAMPWPERDRAACRHPGHPGVFTEEPDVGQRQLRGNLPQAFVRAVLLECAARLPACGPSRDESGHQSRRPGRRPAVSPGKVLSLVRAGVGIVDLVLPEALVRHLAGSQLSDRGRRVVRVLGARQVTQALLSGHAPTEAVLCLGAEADVAHAATMIVLAVLERRYRRAALCDAAIATAFAIAGATAARSVRPEPAGTSRLGARRDQLAERVARIVVPGYPPGSAQPGSATTRTEEHEEAR
jgi:hypothetical protein